MSSGAACLLARRSSLFKDFPNPSVQCHDELMKALYKLFFLATLSSSVVQAQEPKEIHWYVADVPAVHITEGEKKKQGFIDLVLYKQIIPNLPQYKHVVEAVPVARREGKWSKDKQACAPGIFKNGDRGGKVIFSNPYLATLSPGMFTRASTTEEIGPYIDKAGKVSLATLLEQKKLVVGTITGRSYGSDLDALLQKASAQSLFEMTSKNAIESLQKMMVKKRVDAVLANPYEPAFAANGTAKQFKFWPITEQAPYQLVFAACSNTPEGEKIVRALNGIFAQPAIREEAHRYFEAWLKKEDLAVAKIVQEKAATEYK